MSLPINNNPQSDNSKIFAFFDFDGTLTSGDSLMPFLKYCVGSKIFYFKLVLLAPTLLGYFAKLIANDKAKEKVISTYIGGWHQDKLTILANAFCNEVLINMQRKSGMEKLNYHKKKGHYCVLVSASPELYLLPWAKLHGFNAIIATKLTFDNNLLTGELSGDNCYGEKKVKRIVELFGGNCWQNSFAYGDSTADLPMLKKAGEAYLLKNKIFKKIR